MIFKHSSQFAFRRKFAILPLVILLAGGLAWCVTTGARTVATDVQVIEKPVPVPCKIVWPEKPIPHVELVQLTGEAKRDLVLVERAMEAELESRIAYEKLLEAAAKECTEPVKPK